MYQLSANGHLEMWASVCYSRDTDIYSQNTSLTNSYNHKTTIKLFYAVPNISQP